MGEKVPQEVEEEEEGVEEAIITGLITQMSHHFPHSPLATTHILVHAHQTAATLPEGVAQGDYHRYHQEVLEDTAALYEDTDLAENSKRHKVKRTSQ